MFDAVQLVCLCVLSLCRMLIIIMQDGASVLVAVKTCKSDDDPTRTDQLLKEAGSFAFYSLILSLTLIFCCFQQVYDRLSLDSRFHALLSNARIISCT